MLSLQLEEGKAKKHGKARSRIFTLDTAKNATVHTENETNDSFRICLAFKHES